jgi:hypothetical protein
MVLETRIKEQNHYQRYQNCIAYLRGRVEALEAFTEHAVPIGGQIAHAVLGDVPESYDDWTARVDAMIDDGSIGDVVAQVRISDLRSQLAELVAQTTRLAIAVANMQGARYRHIRTVMGED